MVNFANPRLLAQIERERAIAEAIEHDAGGGVQHRYRPVVQAPFSKPSDVCAPPRWIEIMREILELPVPSWSPLVPAAGEIDTERRLPDSRPGGAALLPVNADVSVAGERLRARASASADFQGVTMNPMQQMMARLGAAKPLNTRGEYIKVVGRHTVGVLSYEYKEPNGEKKILATEAVVLESIPATPGGPTYSPGTRLSAHWRMAGLSGFKADNEMARAQGYVVSVLDAQGHVAQLNALPKVWDPVAQEMKSQGQKWIEDEGFKGIQLDQPFRGRVVVINAHYYIPKGRNGQPPPPADKDPFVVVDWLPAPPAIVKDASGQPVRDANGQQTTININTPELIAARRAQWDQQFGPYVPFGAQAPAAGTGAGAAAPSYGHAMQPAPVSVAPQGYPQTAPGAVPPGYPSSAQPQYPPQGYPPGYPQPAPAPVPAGAPGAVPPGYPQQGR